MDKSLMNKISRKKFIRSLTVGGMGGVAMLNSPLGSFASTPKKQINGKSNSNSLGPSSEEPNMIGSYGHWADSLYGDNPGPLSFRNPKWETVDAWKEAAQDRFRELLARPDTGGTPEVTVHNRHSYDGLIIEELSWQLPYGRPTEAYFVKPKGANGPLPGVLGLHDHGGNKYFGKRKIVQFVEDKNLHPAMAYHKDHFYEGRSWANELAKRGFAVLVPDAFAFASRRVLLKNVPERIRRDVDGFVTGEEHEKAIDEYNDWAENHEHIMAKSLFCAGITWPGVFISEDQRALDVLAARSEVDDDRMGCCGLSGGGLRSVMLGGIDSRIKSAVCVGMMTTWKDFLLDKNFIHTWMIYVPHLPRFMDYSEIFTLQMPASRLVLNNSQDNIFTIDEQKRADRILKKVFQKAGAADRYKGEFYPGPHKFDLSMQKSAFEWLKKWLG